jgi:hypothetical protein
VEHWVIHSLDFDDTIVDPRAKHFRSSKLTLELPELLEPSSSLARLFMVGSGRLPSINLWLLLVLCLKI